jgi:hypothetical protein
MKKIINILALLALIIMAMPSCQMKEDDLFDTDPATRQDNWMAEYRRVFNNNKYGWALYTDNPTYGRHPAVFAYAVKFDQQNCTFYKSSATKNMPYVNTLDSVVSMYSFKMDNGVVLSFDTYNAFFHYYADQSEYFSQDLQSDYEFCLDRYSANEDTIFGRGKTKQLPFLMIKMNMTPEEYQKKSDNINNYAAYNCVMMVEGDTLKSSFYVGYHNLLVYFPDSVGGKDVEHMYSYGNLTDGIYLLENIKYKNSTIVEMKLNETTGEFKDRYSDAKIGPRPYADYLMQDADYETWFFDYSGLGTYTKGEWDKAKTALDASGNTKSSNMVYICFSTDGKGGMDLVFNMWYGSDEVHFPMQLKKVSNDEIAIKYTGKETSGRSYSFYDSGLKYIVDALAKKDTWTTYKITYKSGTPMTPQGFILTDESNADNSYYFEPNLRYYHQSIWD